MGADEMSGASPGCGPGGPDRPPAAAGPGRAPALGSGPAGAVLSTLERAVILAACLLLFAKAWQGRLPMSDLQVYLRAGEAMTWGEYLYDPPGSYHFYRFKYPPTSPLLFLPLAWLPVWAAKVSAGVILVACLLAVMRRLEAWAPGPDGGMGPWLCLFAFGGMLQYEFHLGQVTLPILLLLILAVDAVIAGRPGRAGLAFAVSLHFKPLSWPLALWGLARRQWAFLAWTAAWFGVLGLLTIPFFGVAGSVAQWRGFLEEMRQLQDLKQHLATPENHTLASFLFRWLGLARILPEAAHGWYSLAVNVILWAIPLCLALGRRGRADAVDRRDIAWLVAAVPLIGPSEYKYFLLALPVAWMGSREWACLPPAGRLCLVIGLLGVGINIYDLWGKAVSNYLSDISIVTLGGLGLYLTAGLMAHATAAPWHRTERLITFVDEEQSLAPRGRSWTRGDVLSLVLAGLLCGAALLAERENQRQRLVCRRCGEEMAADHRLCKSCGHAGLVLQPVREAELTRRREAARRIRGLEPEAAAVLLQAEFPNLPPEDADRILGSGRPSPAGN